MVFEGEHQKIKKDLVELRVDHFLSSKTKSSLLLSAKNTLNPKLTSGTLGSLIE